MQELPAPKLTCYNELHGAVLPASSTAGRHEAALSIWSYLNCQDVRAQISGSSEGVHFLTVREPALLARTGPAQKWLAYAVVLRPMSSGEFSTTFLGKKRCYAVGRSAVTRADMHSTGLRPQA